MNISSVLIDKINFIQRELKNLKTAHFKTATAIATTSLPSSISIPLKLSGGIYYQEVVGAYKAKVKLTTTDGSNMLSQLYLKGVTPSNMNNRYVFITRAAGGPSESVFEIIIYSQNSEDLTTLQGGGSITLDYQLEAVGTSKFNISVEYEEFNP